jgi:hypothetical protein
MISSNKKTKTALKISKLAVLIVFIVAALSAVSAQDQPRFDYFANNWNVAGLKDYARGARIGPDNTIYLDESQGQVKIRFGGKLNPLSRDHGKTALDGWMPVIRFSAREASVSYEFSCWASPMPDARDWEAAFNWPTEGENFTVWVKYQITNNSNKAAHARLEIISDSLPEYGNHSIDRMLAPGETIEEAARFPFFPVEDPAPVLGADYKIWLKRTIDFWKGLMHSIALIEVPDRKATEALKAAHVCQMIANDLGEVRGGEGFYDQFYIRDGAYQVMELEEAGMWDAARKSIELYLPRQREDGRFESQEGQFDANGQALWVLWHYYKMTNDLDFLKEVYPAMEKAARWTISTLKSTRNDPDYPGLLPAALADGEYLWAGKNHIVGYDFWNLRGLLVTADAARILGKEDQANDFEKQAGIYREAIDSMMAKLDLDWFPPSWELDGTPWGNTETLWPLPIFDKSDPRVLNLINYLRNELGGGYIEGTIQWLGQPDVIHPYMGAYTTMADLILGNDEKVVEDFYWYLLHSTAAHAFPEGIFYKTKTAWSNTIPHVTGACNYAIMLRHMLVHEDGERLELLKAIPDWWLEPGKQIRIEKLPTWFGNISMTITGKEKGVEITFDQPDRENPSEIILHLPENRPLLNQLPGVRVSKRIPQTVRWDFQKVIEIYTNNH